MLRFLNESWKIYRRRRRLAALAELPDWLLADAVGLERAQLESLLAWRAPEDIVAALDNAVGDQVLRQIGSVISARKASNAASSSGNGACGRAARNGRSTTIAAAGPALSLSTANDRPGSRPPLSSR